MINNVKIKDFLESKLFIILVGLLTFGCWGINSVYFTASIFCVLVGVLLLFNAKFYSFGVLLGLAVAGYRDVDISYKDPGLYICIVLAVIVVGYLIYQLILNRQEVFKKISKCSLVYTTLLLGVAMLLSIINSPVKPLSLGLSGLWLLNIAIIIVVAFKIPYSDEAKEKVSFSFVSFLYIIVLETIIAAAIYISKRSYNDLIGIKDFNLGWGLSNHTVIGINMGVIFSCYLFTINKDIYKKIFYIFTCVIGVATTCFVACRGGMLGLAVSGLLVLALFFVIYKKYWKILIISVLGAATAAGLLLLAFSHTDFVSTLLSHFKNIGTTDGGRSHLIKLSTSLFKEHWFIGAGWGSSHYYIVHRLDWTIHNYHSWFFQVIGTCGIVGTIFLFLYLIDLFRVKNYKDTFVLFVFVLVAYCLVHGFVDTVFFSKKFHFFLTIPFAMIKLPNNAISDELILS